MSQSPRNKKPTMLAPGVLRRWPLPQPQEGDDKDGRGRVFVVGGSPEIVGGIILAATAALRAGAGKLMIGTCASVASSVAVTIPEARVIALPETKGGGIDAACAAQVAELACNANAVLFGPGVQDEEATAQFIAEVVPQIDGPTVVLDAGALTCLAEQPKLLYPLKNNVILTPHAGEMASMIAEDKGAIQQDAQETARKVAAQLRAIVALKGGETFIAAPDGATYCNRHGNIGLATSGSGDTLAGVIAGLAARGADPIQAACWGVFLHARAGDVLAKRMGLLGFLARELLAEIPALMHNLSQTEKAKV